MAATPLRSRSAERSSGAMASARLKSSRRYVIIIFAIVAAVATPGGDIISPFVLGLTMYGLYELSIVLVRAGGR